jgi:hypothetical protein
MTDNNSEDRIAALERDLAETHGREIELMKKFAVTQLLADKGFTPAQIKEALPHVLPHIARAADGSLEGVDGALGYLSKTRPDIVVQKVAEYKPVNVPPARGYQVPSDGDEKQARLIFGSKSNSKAANALAMSHPSEYRRLKMIARTLELVA